MLRTAEATEQPSRSAEVWVALGLALGPAAVLGFARFAYALLLPEMRADLGWSYATSGALNTANAVGYLIGALLATAVAGRLGARRAYVVCFVLTVLALAATAASSNVAVLLTVRTLTGVVAAVVFIIGGALVAQAGARATRARAAMLLGVYFAGAGTGIAVSGAVIPPVLAHTDDAAGWRVGWLLLAGLSAIALAVCLPAVRRVGEPPQGNTLADRWPFRELLRVCLSYVLFGAGYIAYMTFVVAFLRGEGAGAGEIGAFWVVLGTAGVLAGFAWGPVLGRLHGGLGPALVLSVVALGAALPLLSPAPWATLGSALLFGGSFLAVVTSFTSVARTKLPPALWSGAIATLTSSFAFGQSAGPILAGTLSDGPSGVRIGMALSVALLVAACMVSLGDVRRRGNRLTPVAP